MNVSRLITDGAGRFASDSPRLDAEILLAHALERDRAYLQAWPEHEPDIDTRRHYFDLVARRCAGEPIAYIVGRRAFWTFDLVVTPDVLIPRAETELLCELAIQAIGEHEFRDVLDLGTGSGAIAMAIKSECPQCTVTATDCSQAALDVASANARRHQLELQLRLGHWFQALNADAGNAPSIHPSYDLIVANPPYVAAGDPHLSRGDLRFEPRQALVADADGLGDLRTIIGDAPTYLRPDGMCLVEHGYDQGPAVRDLMRQAGFRDVATYKDLARVQRVSIGRWLDHDAS